MIWHACADMIYQSGNYRIHWGIQGWTAWNYAKRKACVVRDATLAEAISACEQDSLAKDLKAEFVKA